MAKADCKPRWLRRCRLALGWTALIVLCVPMWAAVQARVWPIDRVASVANSRVQVRLSVRESAGELDVNVRVGHAIDHFAGITASGEFLYGWFTSTGMMVDAQDTTVLMRIGSLRLGSLALLCLVPAALLGRGLLRVSRAKPPNACPTCGYDLRATPQRCPECGTSTARGASTDVNAVSA